MVQLVFPQHEFSIRETAAGAEIFDPLRRRWVRLLPEEWVRQNMIRYLLHVMHYPAALLGVEKEIKLGKLRKRFDLLVFDKNHKPFMLVECKAMEVPLTEDVLQQALRYHLSVPCRYIVVTNGSFCFVYGVADGKLHAMDRFPTPEESFSQP